MKKFTKTISFLLAALMFVLPLSGCGSKGEDQESDTPSEAGDAMTWVADFTGLPEELGSLKYVAVSGDIIYATSMRDMQETDEGTTSGDGSAYQETLYKLSGDGQTCEALADYMPMPLAEGSEGSANIDALCVDPEGNIWTCEEAYSYHFDLPEGFSGTDEEKRPYYVEDGQRYALRKLSPTGAELLFVDLTDVAKSADYFYINGVVCDNEGNIYFSSGNTKLYVYDKNGEQLFTLEVPNYISSVFTFSDGSVGVGSYGQEGYEVLPVDLAAKSWGTSIAMNYPDRIYTGAGDYCFYYTMSSSLFGYNRETGESEKIFNWLDCDIDQDSVLACLAKEDGGMLCVCSSEDENEIALLTEQPASAVAQKTVLTLATVSLNFQLRKEILKFNKASDNYRIKVKEYSEYAVEGDYTAALTKMSTEIIAGNVPDMLDISELPVGQYVSRGLLEDLYPFLDADEELSRDSLVPGIVKAIEVDGGLYQATPGFAIFTVIGSADKVGADMGWTMDEMMACLDEQPEGTELFQQGITQDTMIEIISYLYMNDFVNWQTGECNFESPEFTKLLDFCKMFAKEFDYSEDTYESEVSRIQSGKQLLEITTESDFEDFQMYEAMFGGDIVYKGFPCEDGVGNVALVDSGLAMTTACKDKEGAWSFIRTLFTEDYQTGGNLWTFPTNQAAFNKSLAEAMEKTMTTDENGNEVEEAKGSWGWDGLSVDIYAVTDAQAARIKDLIASVDRVLSIDPNITGIIKEEAAAFFAGDKTAEETAKLVQSRVAIYVSEQS